MLGKLSDSDRQLLSIIIRDLNACKSDRIKDVYKQRLEDFKKELNARKAQERTIKDRIEEIEAIMGKLDVLNGDMIVYNLLIDWLEEMNEEFIELKIPMYENKIRSLEVKLEKFKTYQKISENILGELNNDS